MSLYEVQSMFAAASKKGTPEMTEEDHEEMLDSLRALNDPSVKV